MPLVHQRQTRNNNPFHILSNDDDDDVTVVASNCSPRTPPPNLPTSDLPASQPKTSATQLCPCQRQHIGLPTMPPPRVSATTTSVINKRRQAPTVPIHDLRPKPTNKLSRPTAHSTPPACNIPIVKPDEERSEIHTKRQATPPRGSTRLISSRAPCSISRQALYHVIGLGFLNAPANTIPSSLAPCHQQSNDPFMNIEEHCNGVVHPVTKETITQYKKLINDPILKDLWLKAMSKELHRLAQGYTGTTNGTNTIFYLSHADICNIPNDRTVTYARIVIDH